MPGVVNIFDKERRNRVTVALKCIKVGKVAAVNLNAKTGLVARVCRLCQLHHYLRTCLFTFSIQQREFHGVLIVVSPDFGHVHTSFTENNAVLERGVTFDIANDKFDLSQVATSRRNREKELGVVVRICSIFDLFCLPFVNPFSFVRASFVHKNERGHSTPVRFVQIFTRKRHDVTGYKLILVILLVIFAIFLQIRSLLLGGIMKVHGCKLFFIECSTVDDAVNQFHHLRRVCAGKGVQDFAVLHQQPEGAGIFPARISFQLGNFHLVKRLFGFHFLVLAWRRSVNVCTFVLPDFPSQHRSKLLLLFFLVHHEFALLFL
mmetsp:Transcript_19130/g.37768  ORF Transcript_19130/g.37768 Transcript_19130/m.37768 type:complete len:319 (+) Transcript_19130:4355-5311(+)